MISKVKGLNGGTIAQKMAATAEMIKCLPPQQDSAEVMKCRTVFSLGWLLQTSRCMVLYICDANGGISILAKLDGEPESCYRTQQFGHSGSQGTTRFSRTRILLLKESALE
ncbi:hypothetical protein FRX31_034559 [Thalictrum thalictroides]|uniref:Uncharacterized protein n=1 Tax=Thalictrum thalictroides TaxID=46969 RepID=A0A7J6UTF3_THATH|nr:hypothetical protein FRX31_034559 [Thalictrum thalictroides]